MGKWDSAETSIKDIVVDLMLLSPKKVKGWTTLNEDSCTNTTPHSRRKQMEQRERWFWIMTIIHRPEKDAINTKQAEWRWFLGVSFGLCWLWIPRPWGGMRAAGLTFPSASCCLHHHKGRLPITIRPDDLLFSICARTRLKSEREGVEYSSTHRMRVGSIVLKTIGCSSASISLFEG